MIDVELIVGEQLLLCQSFPGYQVLRRHGNHEHYTGIMSPSVDTPKRRDWSHSA